MNATDVDVERRKGMLIVTLRGSFDSDSVPKLQKALECLCTRVDESLLVDITKADFSNDSARSYLMRCARDLNCAGKTVMISGISNPVKDLFKSADEFGQVKLFTDRVGALLSFAYSAREDVGVHERRLGDERRGIVHEFAGSEHRKLDRRHHKEDWGESILPATA